MINTFSKAVCTLALLGFGAVANAASVSLVGQAPPNPVSEGDIVSLDVVIDFSEEATLGGGFDVTFDETQLGFVDFTQAGLGDPDFNRDPDVTPGRLAGWGVGDFNGLSGGTVGSVSFEVLAGATSSVVALGPDSTGIAGVWVSAVTFAAFDPQPDYNQVTVEVAPIPLPAAAWLFGSALLGLAGVSRRKRAA